MKPVQVADFDDDMQASGESKRGYIGRDDMEVIYHVAQ